MSSIDRYARAQVIIDNIRSSLVDLQMQKEKAVEDLFRIDKQIEKHLEFLDKLENEEF